MSFVLDDDKGAARLRDAVFAPLTHSREDETEAPPVARLPADWRWRGVGFMFALCVFSVAVLTIR